MLALKSLLVVNALWQLVNIINAMIEIHDGASFRKLSKEGFFIIIRLSGDIATVCFLITGIILRRKVEELPR